MRITKTRTKPFLKRMAAIASLIQDKAMTIHELADAQGVSTVNIGIYIRELSGRLIGPKRAYIESWTEIEIDRLRSRHVAKFRMMTTGQEVDAPKPRKLTHAEVRQRAKARNKVHGNTFQAPIAVQRLALLKKALTDAWDDQAPLSRPQLAKILGIKDVSVRAYIKYLMGDQDGPKRIYIHEYARSALGTGIATARYCWMVNGDEKDARPPKALSKKKREQRWKAQKQKMVERQALPMNFFRPAASHAAHP